MRGHARHFRYPQSDPALRIYAVNSNHYVWLWLPGQVQPTLCGVLQWDGVRGHFAYLRSYLSNPRAISIEPSWPLNKELGKRLGPIGGDALPAAIADVGPGRWGEYVITQLRDGVRPNALRMLLVGAGGRSGAIEFSASAQESPNIRVEPPLLHDIAAVIDQLDKGRPLTVRLPALFRHGTSLGGHRPKVTVLHRGGWWIAKFGSVSDSNLQQPQMEAFALALAAKAGIETPEHCMDRTDYKSVLLVKRFDRDASGHRSHMLSAKTLLQLSARNMGMDASYPAIGRLLLQYAADSAEAARWFDRMVFNIAIGNTDDHALNHLFGWDGKHLRLMPAFDLSPEFEAPNLRMHEMEIGPEGARGSYDNALQSHDAFGLSREQAESRLHAVADCIRDHWQATLKASDIFDAGLTEQVRQTLLLDVKLG